MSIMRNSQNDYTDNLGGYQVEYYTTTGRHYPLEICYGFFPTKLVPVDKKSTIEACRTGCNLYGRNGGCPPFAPSFSKLSSNNFLVLYAKMLTKDFPAKVLSGPYYSRWVFVETFMTALTNRIGKHLASELGAFFLSSGHCSSCRPKRCSIKEGNSCVKPDTKTYSLEATGVLVTELMENLFGLELQWWKPREPHYIPRYMIKVIGLTRKKAFEAKETEHIVLSALKKDRILF